MESRGGKNSGERSLERTGAGECARAFIGKGRAVWSMESLSLDLFAFGATSCRMLLWPWVTPYLIILLLHCAYLKEGCFSSYNFGHFPFLASCIFGVVQRAMGSGEVAFKSTNVIWLHFRAALVVAPRCIHSTPRTESSGLRPPPPCVCDTSFSHGFWTSTNFHWEKQFSRRGQGHPEHALRMFCSRPRNVLLVSISMPPSGRLIKKAGDLPPPSWRTFV